MRHICASLELFAKAVMPAFKRRHAAREKKKQKELAPYIERALARKQRRPRCAMSEIPAIVALGGSRRARVRRRQDRQLRPRRRDAGAAGGPAEEVAGA